MPTKTQRQNFVPKKWFDDTKARKDSITSFGSFIQQTAQQPTPGRTLFILLRHLRRKHKNQRSTMQTQIESAASKWTKKLPVLVERVRTLEYVHL